MINKYTGPSEMCLHCHQHLESIGTQSFCPSCSRFASNLTQELRVVPEQYESNCKMKIQLQKDRRYNALLRQFTDKHWQIRSKEELDLYRQRLNMIKSRSYGKKGSREAAAVVVYFHMQDQIKQTIKEYCQANNLSLKLFHQKYKIYLKAIRQNSDTLPTYLPLLKEQEELNKLEQSPTEKESHDYFYSSEDEELPSVNEQQGMSFLERAKHAILLIYDHIFQKFLFKQKKNMIINGLMAKFEEIEGKTLKSISYNQNQPLKTYYLVFAVIKSLGYAINFLQFADIVHKQTKFVLKRKKAGQIKKIYQQQDSPSPCKSTRDEDANVKEEELEEQNPKIPVAIKKKTKGQSKQKHTERVELSDSELGDCHNNYF